MFGYRKLIAAAASLALSTTLLGFHLLSGDNWVTFNTFQLGFFFGANVASKLWGKDSEPA